MYILAAISYVAMGLILVGTEVRFGFPIALLFNILFEKNEEALEVEGIGDKVYYVFLWPLMVAIGIVFSLLIIVKFFFSGFKM